MLERLERCELEDGDDPVELERGDARLLLRVDRRPRPSGAVAARRGRAAAAAVRPAEEGAALRTAPELPALPPLARAAAVRRVRSLSYSALALFDQCSYRFYARAHRRPAAEAVRRRRPGRRSRASLATEIGDAVHALLEVRPDEPAGRDLATACARSIRRATDENLERIASLRRRVVRVGARAARSPALGGHAARAGRSRSSTTACWFAAASTCSAARASVRSSSTTRRTARGARAGRDRRGRVPAPAARLRAGLLPGRARRRSRSSTTFLERPDAIRVDALHPRRARRRSKPSCRPRSRAIQAGRFPPDAERVGLRGLPGAGRRVRGPAAPVRAVADPAQFRAPSGTSVTDARDFRRYARTQGALSRVPRGNRENRPVA